MPTATIDGIVTSYDVLGSGPALLMFAPGGFSATMQSWRTQGIYKRLGLLDQLTPHYRCVVFDKREAGESGGRVEAIGWRDYARQGLGLLDHLGIEHAHVMGGCVGCSIAVTMAVTSPDRVGSLVLYSPAGGPRYRMTQLARMGEHQAYVVNHGLGGVVRLAGETDKGYSQDPRVGPWVTVIRRDRAFAEAYAAQDLATYVGIAGHLAEGLFDRDTAPGPEAEELMTLEMPALVVPGHDASHATSAARYLEECLSRAQYWDKPVEDQTAETAPARILEFLDAV